MPSVSYKVPTFNSFSSFLSSTAAETSGDQTWTFAGPTYTLKLTGNFNEMNKTGPITGFEITKGGDVIVNTFAFLSPFSLDLETFRTELGKSAGMGAAYLLSGDETINGTEGEDNLQGFEGADFLYGGKDSDQIFGGGGNDFINAGEGDDFINAGDGDDRIVFNGNDAGTSEIIYGGNGKDTVRFDGSVSTPLFTMDSVEQLQFGAAAKVELSQFFNNGVNDMVITGSAGVNTLALTISLVDMFGDPVSRSLDFTAYTFESWGPEDEFTVTGSELADMIRGPQVKAVLDGGAGDDALIAGLGADRLVGGAGADTLVGGRGDDTYVVDGADDVFESAGGGVDTILTAASFSLSSLVQIENLALADAAGTTASKLTGNALANAITGDAGANVLAGGAGKDKLTGGLGKDTFVFNTAPNKSTNVDLVTDFKRVDDTFHLDNKYFKTIGKDGKLLKDAFVVGKKAVDAEDRVIYDKGTGNLFYDADGTGKAAAIKIAVLQNKVGLTAADFIVI